MFSRSRWARRRSSCALPACCRRQGWRIAPACSISRPRNGSSVGSANCRASTCDWRAARVPSKCAPTSPRCCRPRRESRRRARRATKRCDCRARIDRTSRRSRSSRCSPAGSSSTRRNRWRRCAGGASSPSCMHSASRAASNSRSCSQAAAIIGTCGALLGIVLGHRGGALGLGAIGGDLGAGYFRGLAARVRSARRRDRSVLGARRDGRDRRRIAPGRRSRARADRQLH